MDNNKIKIAQIIGRTINGGVENLIMNYYQAIDRDNIQFDFLVESESKIINKASVENLGGNIVIIPPCKNVITYQKQLIKIFKEKRYDIVQANINSLSVFPLRAAKKAGIKIRISNSLSTSNKSEVLRNLIKIILKQFSKRYATHYFACSNLAGKWLYGSQIEKDDKFYKIPNAINEEKYFYSEQFRKELLKKHNLQGKLIFGTIGRLENQKNQSFLIDVFKEIYKKNESTQLIIIGDGGLEFQLREKIHNYNLDSSVLILTSNEVGVRGSALKYYSLFDVFVLPSLYEGLPTVGVEAQVNGLPCYFSTEITEETRITNRAHFISLDKEPEYWAEAILNGVNERIKEKVFIEDYDIKSQAETLMILYKKFIEGEN